MKNNKRVIAAEDHADINILVVPVAFYHTGNWK